MSDDLQKQAHEADKRRCEAQANLKYILLRFGDHLAQREGYKEHKGLSAIHFYLVGKYRWPPSLVRSLNQEDLQFLLDEEMHGWTFRDP